jgi:hypothetical protein
VTPVHPPTFTPALFAAVPGVILADTPRPDPSDDAAVDRAWSSLRAQQPRLYDGEVLLLSSRAPLGARRARYRHLATASVLGRSVRSLGVQGVVIARDHRHHEHLLLGRRSGDTRIYQGLWENAPSGSLAPPAPPADRLSSAAIIDSLRDEGLEELGIDLAGAGARWLGLLDDPAAGSTDIVIELRPCAPIDPRASICTLTDGRWEYADAAWIALADLPAWRASHRAAISPPTHALLDHLTPDRSGPPRPATPGASSPSPGPSPGPSRSA